MILKIVSNVWELILMRRMKILLKTFMTQKLLIGGGVVLEILRLFKITLIPLLLTPLIEITGLATTHQKNITFFPVVMMKSSTITHHLHAT